MASDYSNSLRKYNVNMIYIHFVITNSEEEGGSECS